MENDQRGRMPAIPERLEEVLNELQMLGLRQMENFGWHLLFVRRPLFQESVPVLVDGEGRRFGMLAPDGHILMDPDIGIRELAASPSEERTIAGL